MPPVDGDAEAVVGRDRDERDVRNLLNLLLLANKHVSIFGPILWAIAVPSVTRCRRCRCGH